MSHVPQTTSTVSADLRREIEARSLPALRDIIDPYDTRRTSDMHPRPSNNFILFRTWVGKAFGKVPLAHLVWAALKADESPIVHHFSILSRDAKLEHEEAFPGYIYRPKKGQGGPAGRKAPSRKKLRTRGKRDNVEAAAAATPTIAKVGSNLGSFTPPVNTLAWAAIQNPNSFSHPIHRHSREPGPIQQATVLPLYDPQTLCPLGGWENHPGSNLLNTSEAEGSTLPYPSNFFISSGPQTAASGLYPSNQQFKQGPVDSSTQWHVNASTEAQGLKLPLCLLALNADSPATDDSPRSAHSNMSQTPLASEADVMDFLNNFECPESLEYGYV